MRPEHACKFVLIAFSLFFLLACSGTFTTEFPTATSVISTEAATATPSPVSLEGTPTPANLPFLISTLTYSETGQNSEFTIHAQYPVISDSNDPGAQAFNNEIQALVQTEIVAFKKSVSELPADPAVGASSLDLKYDLLFQNDRLASIKFNFSAYTGGAHPYDYSKTVNYDFNQSRSLALDELFLPDTHYLEAISKYCNAELSKRDIGFEAFSSGAVPAPENYRNWNITADGLMITFDEYQVAAYAAGPQTVIVPYSELQAILNPALLPPQH